MTAKLTKTVVLRGPDGDVSVLHVGTDLPDWAVGLVAPGDLAEATPKPTKTDAPAPRKRRK